MTDELDIQTMKEFVGFRAKTCSYLKDNNNKDRKAKGTKNCVPKIKLKFKDYKKCEEAAQTKNKINQLDKTKLA